LPSSALLPRQNRRLLLALAREDPPKRYGAKTPARVARQTERCDPLVETWLRPVRPTVPFASLRHGKSLL